MTWRRILWFCFLIALGWGLYLFVPPKPRWTLPLHEVPLKANAARVLTMVLAPTDEPRPWLPAESVGPVNLRDLTTGQILATMPALGKDWDLINDPSPDLRLLALRHLRDTDQEAVSIHVLETGKRSVPMKNVTHEFSPRSSILLAKDFDTKHLLIESADGQVLAKIPARFGLKHFAADDSWALFNGPEKDDGDINDRWLLWQRDRNTIREGALPGRGFLTAITVDGRTAFVISNDEKQLSTWDVLRGEPLYELKSSFQRDIGGRFIQDGRILWVTGGPGDFHELFEVATGKRIFFKTTPEIERGSLSRDGRLIAYLDGNIPPSVVVVDTLSWHERWRRSHTELKSVQRIEWTDDNRLVARFGMFVLHRGGYGTGEGALIWEGETGREIFSRPKGDLATNKQCWITFSYSQELGDRLRLPDALVRWLPWIRDGSVESLSVEKIESGKELFHRVQRHMPAQGLGEMSVVYCDSETLVLWIPERPAEIWDIPPARRCLWILAPPVALVALPRLWRMARRKKCEAGAFASNERATN